MNDELTSGIDLVVSIVKLFAYGLTSFVSSIISFIFLEDKSIIKKHTNFLIVTFLSMQLQINLTAVLKFPEFGSRIYELHLKKNMFKL